MIPVKNSLPGRTFVAAGNAYATALAEVNWRAILFWSALWWFVYSAPPEGLLTRTFLEPTHVPITELAEGL
jgi:hypothetical protein